MSQQNEQTSQVLSTLFPFTMSLLCLVFSMYIDVKQTQSQTKHRIHYVDFVTHSVCVDEKKAKSHQQPTSHTNHHYPTNPFYDLQRREYYLLIATVASNRTMVYGNGSITAWFDFCLRGLLLDAALILLLISILPPSPTS